MPDSFIAAIDIALGDVLIAVGEPSVDVQPSDPSNPEDQRAAELTHVDRSVDHLVVRTPKLRAWLSRRGGSVAVTVHVPAGSRVHATVQVGDVRSEGPLGDCRIKTSLGDIRIDEGGTLSLRTAAGDIAVERATGDVDVTTGSGEVRLRALDRGGVVKNSNGDTWVGTADGELRISGANGAIAVESARGGVEARSANGDLRLGEVTGGSVSLATALGDVAVGIPEGTAAWLDVKASAGRLRNDLGPGRPPEGSSESVEVRARTGMGDIVIQRAPAR